MKIITVIIITVFLLSCSQHPAKQKIISDNSSKYTKICIEDHIYYYGGNTLALKVNDNGLPIKCDKLNLK